jgi:hypothetical protein
MRFHAIFLVGALVSLPALGPGLAYAQSQTPAATPQPVTTNASPPLPPAQGQSPQNQAAQSQAAPLANAKPASAKVWTNEDVSALRSDNGVSVVGNRRPQRADGASRTSSQEKDAAWYRNQLATLRDDMEKLDVKIAKLQAFLSGENVGEQASLHPRMVPTPQEQLKEAQTKRQADSEKIEDLVDRARHNGIEPGALR